ncbi:MAG: type VI secretion system lipoprotein TssJ [Reinekea sp.]
MKNKRSSPVVKALICSLLLLPLVSCAVIDQRGQPSWMTYSLVATETINPNASGDATPLEVQVFELEDDSMFLSADFDQLTEDAKKALKSNYINHRDFVMLPGQFKFIDTFEVSQKTSYIGVMARFAAPNSSDWKKVVKVLPANKQYHLLIYFDDQSVKLDQVE